MHFYKRTLGSKKRKTGYLYVHVSFKSTHASRSSIRFLCYARFAHSWSSEAVSFATSGNRGLILHCIHHVFEPSQPDPHRILQICTAELDISKHPNTQNSRKSIHVADIIPLLSYRQKYSIYRSPKKAKGMDERRIERRTSSISKFRDNPRDLLRKHHTAMLLGDCKWLENSG